MANSFATKRAVTIKYPWMFDRNYDLFFLFFSFLIGVGAYLVTTTNLAASSVLFAVLVPTAFGLGPFHQGPTWLSYFDAKNRQWFKSEPKKKLIFFAGPPLIFVFTVLGVFLCKWLVIAIWLLWSIKHLVQQNIGILLLYHNHNRGEAVVDRVIETRSINYASLFFTLVMIRRLYMGTGSFWVFDLIVAGSGIVAFTLSTMYLKQLSDKIKAGEYLNMPALIFWFLSVGALAPMAFIGKSFPIAFLAPVTWHWIQYIGLNFRLVKNKYGEVQIPELSSISDSPKAANAGISSNITDLPIARPLLLFFATCISLAVINTLLATQITSTPGIPVATATAPAGNEFLSNIFIGLLLGFAHCHFFLDAYIWRFREEYPRQAILPYLKTKS